MLFVEWACLLVVISYICLMACIFYGSRSQKNYVKEATVKPMTVLVPSKDEEKNIGRCLQALTEQHFPEEKLEIIVLNDNSTDKTGEIAKQYSKTYPFIKVVDIPTESRNHLIGKSNAIDIGVSIAQNDIILICDADCEPNPKWLTTICSAFTKNVGVVSGFTLLDEQRISSKLFGIVQNLDWLMLQGVASGSVGLQKPISCIGSNFAFTKNAYNDVGGYSSLPFSITEDLLLYQTISKQTNYAYVYPMESGSINFSEPMETFNALYQQRKRWAFGSLGMGGFGAISGLINVLAHLLALVYAFLFFNPVPLISIVFVDCLYLHYLLNALKQKQKWYYSIFYISYYYMNVLIFPLLFLFDRKIVWKNRIYTKEGVV